MNTIRIRPYLTSDYGEIARIHDAARKTELSLAGLEDAFLPFSVAAEREDFFGYSHIDVAVWNNCIVGFSAYTSDELAWLYVSPAWTRRGIGRALVKHALENEPGIHTIEVLFGNEPARLLYESCGFCVCGILEGVMPGNESFAVKAYRMTKKT